MGTLRHPGDRGKIQHPRQAFDDRRRVPLEEAAAENPGKRFEFRQ